MRIQIYANQSELAAAAAALISDAAQEAIRARGQFDIALSGGSTPLSCYAALAAPPHSTSIDWARVHVFWSDERCVPPDHPWSNYATAKQALLERVPLPAGNVHRMHGELPPNEGAEEYRQALLAHFGGPGFPVFDLILLGLGADGHTASLFPGSLGVRTGEVPVTENYISSLESWRLTFTFPLINSARKVAFLVAGSAKSDTVREVIEGKKPLPAKAINPHSGELVWLLDAEAAALLKSA